MRAWDGEKTTGVRSIVGCRLDLTDGTALLVYPTDKAAYGRMCRLLSVGKKRAGTRNMRRLISPSPQVT